MSLAFSPNGKNLAIAAASLQSASLTPTTPRYIDLIDPATGERTGYLEVGLFNPEAEAGTPDSRRFTSITYLPDGNLAVSWFDGGTTIWNPSSRRSVKHFDVGGAALADTPDGRTLAVGRSNGDVALIDVRTGAVSEMDSHHAGPVTSVVFTPDGNTLITSGIDGTIKVWDVPTARLRATFRGTGGLAVSADGSSLYSSGPGSEIVVWDLTGTRALSYSTVIGAGYPQFAVGGGGLVAYLLPGGPHAPATKIGLWDTNTGATSTIAAVPRQTCYVSLSPDATRLLESCDGGYGGKVETPRNVALWNLGSGERIGNVLRSSGGASWDGAFSPDSSRFATLSDDLFPIGATGGATTSTVTVRDATSMRIVARHQLTGSAGVENGVLFSPDGRLIAAATTQSADVRVWDVATGLLVGSPEVGQHIDVKSMAFSPDSGTLALALATGVVRLVNTTTWRDAAPPISAVADSIAYTPDGTYLAIANAGDVSLWDVASGRHVGDAYLGSPDHQYGTIRTLPDGRIVLMIENEPTFLYRADLASWKAQACSIVGEVTPAQWQTMVPDEPYRPTCAA